MDHASLAEDHVQTAQRKPRRRLPRLLLFWLIMLCGATYSIYLGVNSPGTPLHDEITHFLIAHEAWRNPVVILDVWGRPGNTLFYLLPSLFSVGARRWWALGASALTVVTAARTASRLGLRQIALAALFLWLQPWFIQLGFTSITQIPFMLALTLGIELWASGRAPHSWSWVWASLCFGLLPLIRHEGVALLAIWMSYLLLRRAWPGLVAASLPMIAWNGLYYAVYGRLASGNLIDLRPTDIYGSGDWLHFVAPTVDSVGVPIVVLSALGLVVLWRRQRSALVYMLPAAFYFVVHTVIYRFGLFASGGYTLFLLPIAPTIAILAALGAVQLVSMSVSSSRLRPIVLAVLLGAALIWQGRAVLGVTPWRLQPNEIAIEQAADWLRTNVAPETPVYSTHVWLFWIYDEPGLRRIPGGGTGLTSEDIPPGALLIWDPQYGDLNGVDWAELTTRTDAWTLLETFYDGQAVLFRRQD